jgi:cobalamin biosynthesis Mg chelatase CobN
MATETEQPVTRHTIEATLREIRGEVETTAQSARPYAVMAGVVAAVAVVGVAYLLGRRKGKKRTTLVEVRRV